MHTDSFVPCSHQKGSPPQASNPTTASLCCSDVPQSFLELKGLKSPAPMPFMAFEVLRATRLGKVQGHRAGFWTGLHGYPFPEHPPRYHSKAACFPRTAETPQDKRGNQRHCLEPSNANYDTGGDSSDRVSSTLTASPLALLGHCWGFHRQQ